MSPLGLRNVLVLFTIPKPRWQAAAASELGSGHALGLPETAATQDGFPPAQRNPQILSSHPNAFGSAAKEPHLKHPPTDPLWLTEWGWGICKPVGDPRMGGWCPTQSLWHSRLSLRSCDKTKLSDNFFFIFFHFSSTNTTGSKCDLLFLCDYAELTKLFLEPD